MKSLAVLVVCFLVIASAKRQDEDFSNFDWLEHGADWPDLFPTGYCGGLSQSPIDIALSNARFTGLPQLRTSGARTEPRTLNYITAFVEEVLVTRNENQTLGVTKRQDGPRYGNTVVQVEADEFNPIFMIGGTVLEPWTLIDYVFHAPSEHTFEGLRFPLEVQFNHESEFGQAAIVSYMFRTTEYSAPFITVIAEAIRNGDDTALLTAQLPILSGTFFHYRGSFTTPPCEERVDWHVYKTAIPICSEDLETITNAMTAFNFRETQDLNGRSIGVSDGCGLGGGHFAFSGGRSCKSSSHGYKRSILDWESTPFAPFLKTQQQIVGVMFSNPELRNTGEIFADILEYNKRAVLDDSVEGDYHYTMTFPEIKDADAQARAEDLARAFARATISMESMEYEHFDARAALSNFNSSFSL